MYNSFLIIFKILLGLECCSEIWFDGCCPGLHQRYPGTLLSGVPDTCWPRGHRSWKLDLGGFSFCRHPQSVQLASMWFQTKTISLKSSNFIWKWYNLVIIIYYNTYIPFSVNKKQKYFLSVTCFCYLILARGSGCNNRVQLVCCRQGRPGESKESEGASGESRGENKPQRSSARKAKEVPLPAEENPLKWAVGDLGISHIKRR